MSLKKNILANYFSQIYVAIIGIALLPLYMKYMGSEAYGLVGFFTTLQSLFALLDIGLTPTIARETSRFRGAAISALFYRQLYRALAILFSFIAVIGGGLLLAFSEVLAIEWLNTESLPLNEVILSVQIMSLSVACRWMTGLFRGVITGSEKLVWLSFFNIIIASTRFGGVLISMYIFGFTPLVFFIHQLLIILVEFVILGYQANRLLPKPGFTGEKIGWSLQPVKRVLKFSLTVAFTAAIWVCVTQIDKLVLSGVLSLSDYGYFSIAVLVASGIMLVSGPVSNALMPRMAKLYAENKHDEMIYYYRKSTQLVTVIAGSVSISLILNAKTLLVLWTGNLELVDNSTPILKLYALGNLFLCIAAFSYYLQYAKGNLKYHFIGNVGLALLLIPSIIFMAQRYGGVGAGYVWVVVNACFFFFWVAYIHYKLEKGLHLKWLFNDVLKVILPGAIIAIIFSITYQLLDLNSFWVGLFTLIFSSLIILLSALLSSQFGVKFNKGSKKVL